MDTMNKILATFVAEVIEAIFFIILILIVALLGENIEIIRPIAESVISGLLGLWALMGVVITPLLIFSDFADLLLKSSRKCRI